jgi:hypothetical protein
VTSVHKPAPLLETGLGLSLSSALTFAASPVWAASLIGWPQEMRLLQDSVINVTMTKSGIGEWEKRQRNVFIYGLLIISYFSIGLTL